jgi:hypothetical protein
VLIIIAGGLLPAYRDCTPDKEYMNHPAFGEMKTLPPVCRMSLF